MDTPQAPPSARGIFCNRTLNLRAIKAIGYDMDYTLVHYRVAVWEQQAYDHLRDRMIAMGWPLQDLTFDPARIIRGLVIDTERGNLLKANRFGFVKKALHGTRPLSYEELRDAYGQTIIDLSEPRWYFLNTLFSLSEGCLYAQIVDLLDAGRLSGAVGYLDIFRKVRTLLDDTHVEGKLKAQIIAHPEAYVVQDAETALTLLDQKHAGKKLLLITNSEWEYTQAMMAHAFDGQLPPGMTWRDLFDLVIVSARKPDFFTTNSPLYEVATPEGLLRPALAALRSGSAYVGGSARQIERALDLSGDEILYVGDHMFGDVRFTKSVLRWRTALVLRELEEEILALEHFRESEARISGLMDEKERLEARQCTLRVLQQRRRTGYGPVSGPNPDALHHELAELRTRLATLDAEIAPLAKAASELSNPTWGLLTRAGNDKSHLARQVERYADVYTSRVSNFLHATPFVYLRSRRGSLPHDPTTPGGAPIAPSNP